MEVLIYEEQWLTLGRNVAKYKFEFPDGTTSVAFARSIYLPPFRMTKELLDQLISAGLTPRIKVGQLTDGLEVYFGIQLIQPTTGPVVASIEMIGGDLFLQSVFGGDSRYLEEAKVQLNVTKIVGPCVDHHPVLSGYIYGGKLEVAPTERSLIFNFGHRDPKIFEVSSTQCDNWTHRWRLGNWTILLSVELVLPRFIGAGPAVPDLLAATRKMLTDEVLADTKVIAQNGAEIKFHRSILAAHSPTFERMFHTKMQEAISGVLELPDMTEESVRALKEYLYVWDLKTPQENSLVCFELFEAGHKYGISSLEEATSRILLRKGGAWYSAVVALQRFLEAKGCGDFKTEAVRIEDFG